MVGAGEEEEEEEETTVTEGRVRRCLEGPVRGAGRRGWGGFEGRNRRAVVSNVVDGPIFAYFTSVGLRPVGTAWYGMYEGAEGLRRGKQRTPVDTVVME